MEIIVRGKHFDVPSHVEERARRKLSRLDRYLPLLRDAAVEVDLTQEKAKQPDRRYVVHVTVNGHGIHLQAEERAAEPAAAVDRAVQVLSRQAQRRKERLYERSHARTPKAVGEIASPVEAGDAGAGDEDAHAHGRVTRVKTFPIKPMVTAEAIEQMEALGHDFYLFFDADADQFAVLYVRHAGDYGLIRPEPT